MEDPLEFPTSPAPGIPGIPDLLVLPQVLGAGIQDLLGIRVSQGTEGIVDLLLHLRILVRGRVHQRHRQPWNVRNSRDSNPGTLPTPHSQPFFPAFPIPKGLLRPPGVSPLKPRLRDSRIPPEFRSRDQPRWAPTPPPPNGDFSRFSKILEPSKPPCPADPCSHPKPSSIPLKPGKPSGTRIHPGINPGIVSPGSQREQRQRPGSTGGAGNRGVPSSRGNPHRGSPRPSRNSHSHGINRAGKAGKGPEFPAALTPDAGFHHAPGLQLSREGRAPGIPWRSDFSTPGFGNSRENGGMDGAGRG